MARLALVMVLLGIPTSVRAQLGDTTARPTVVVRFFQHSASEEQLTTARHVAGGILAAAGIGVSWVECRPGSPERSSVECERPLARRELVLRVAAAADAAAIGNARALGFSLIDREAAAGTVATVYTDRVAALASVADVDRAGVLGRAIAHEIGHLLLGTNRHARRGLMRAVWSNADLRRDRPADWLFSQDEAVAMRRAAAARARCVTCSSRSPF